jgi:NTE family protein
MVDGGVRNVSPLGDVLDSDPAEVVIINCNRQTPSRTDKPFKNALDIGNAALEIALNEIFITDVREFIQINRNVEEAAERGVNLHKEDGTEFKFYKYSLIEPDEPLGDTLDFSSAAIKRSMEAGWEKAKQVLG